MNNYNRDVGYKIKIKGKVSAQEVIEILAAELLNLQENFGVEEFSGVNFYCQMYKDDENQTLISNKTGEEICGVVVESKNKHKTINKIDNSKKIISYNKSIDFENLEKSVSSLIDNTFIISDNYNLLSSYKSKAEINRIEEERRKNFAELREKEQRQRTFEKEIQIKKQKEEKEFILKFKHKIKSDFNIENDDDFKLKVNSFACIIAPHTIKIYLGELDSYDEKYFRVTLKNKETQKAGDVYIYNLNLEQIKHVKKGA